MNCRPFFYVFIDLKEESISTVKEERRVKDIISFGQNGRKRSRNLLKRTQKEEKLNTQTQFMAPLWWWMVGMGFAFFRLIAPFGGQKLEILGNSQSGRRERPTFFLVEANFVLFHFSSHPHKNSEKVMDFLYFYYRQVDGFAPTFSTKPTIRQDTDGSLVFHCSILADPRPVVTWFHNGDKIQDNKKFQVSRNSLLSLLSSRYLLGKHLTF